jgi:hypothetical protein
MGIAYTRKDYSAYWDYSPDERPTTIGLWPRAGEGRDEQ